MAMLVQFLNGLPKNLFVGVVVIAFAHAVIQAIHDEYPLFSLGVRAKVKLNLPCGEEVTQFAM
jgi:hypothetical protein